MSQSRFHIQTRHGHARMHVRCLDFSIFDFCKVAKERTLFIRSFLLDICAQRHGVRLLSDDLFVGEKTSSKLAPSRSSGNTLSHNRRRNALSTTPPRAGEFLLLSCVFFPSRSFWFSFYRWKPLAEGLVNLYIYHHPGNESYRVIGMNAQQQAV